MEPLGRRWDWGQEPAGGPPPWEGALTALGWGPINWFQCFLLPWKMTHLPSGCLQRLKGPPKANGGECLGIGRTLRARAYARRKNEIRRKGWGQQVVGRKGHTKAWGCSFRDMKVWPRERTPGLAGSGNRTEEQHGKGNNRNEDRSKQDVVSEWWARGKRGGWISHQQATSAFEFTKTQASLRNTWSTVLAGLLKGWEPSDKQKKMPN